MTLVATAAPERAAPHGVALWPVWCVAMIGAFLVAAPNLLDPMIRYDDYPALFAEPEGFWAKTLHEGRWLNYVWHLRGFETPAWLNFALYQTLWASFAAGLATVAIRPRDTAWPAAILALLIVIAPSATLISLWFNTLIPGLAVVALFALLACRISHANLLWLLPPFVLLSFWAYTTYPLLLLAVCLAHAPQRSWRHLISLLALFTTSFALAILATYALNWQVHGIFGVPLASWRAAVPAVDLAGLIANLPLLAETLTDLGARLSFEFRPALYFHGLLAFGAAAFLVRRAPMHALYLAAGFVTGMALIVLQVLKLGVVIPPRTFAFAWIFYALLLIAALRYVPLGLSTRMATNAALLIVGSYGLQTFLQYTTYRAWQAETHAIAAAVPAQSEALQAVDPTKLASAKAAFIQNDQALQFRLQQLTGTRGIVCTEGCDQARVTLTIRNGVAELSH